MIEGKNMENKKTIILLEEIRGNKEVALTLLKLANANFLNKHIEIDEEHLIIESELEEGYFEWKDLEEKIDEEKLRILINIGHLYDALENSKYTYNLTPDSLVFTANGIPRLIFAGVKNQVPPFDSLSESEFLARFKAMIISLLDKRYEYDDLISGQLPFYKGKLFCESIVNLDSVKEVIAILQDEYRKEKENNSKNYTRVRISTLTRLKWTAIITSIVFFVSLIGLAYMLFVSLPQQETVAKLRLAFVDQDYSKVVSTVKNVDSKSLSQDDRYMVAYSVIKTEPLTNKQKEELEKISKLTNADYLRYWVLIGQSNIDGAIDIASYLDDPQLLMYGLTKKIDEVQRNPNLSSDDRTKQLDDLKSKLDELKEKYLKSDSTLDIEGSADATSTTSSTSSNTN